MNNVVAELGSEKIDIIKYSDDPAQYVAAALSPADVLSVLPLEGSKSCRVVVPDDQLSLAIGKEGQNARLAAKLTGYKIDIKSASAAHEWGTCRGLHGGSARRGSIQRRDPRRRSPRSSGGLTQRPTA